MWQARPIRWSLLAAIACVGFVACSDDDGSPPPSTTTASASPAASQWPAPYASAIVDAQNPEPGDVVHDLVAIAASNRDLRWWFDGDEPRVLVVTLAPSTKYYADAEDGWYENGEHEIWVTAVPELRERCRSAEFIPASPASPVPLQEPDDGLRLRLRQILGLPPDHAAGAVIELWVLPGQLFRPAPDSEIDDRTAGLEFPQGVTAEHRQWFNALRARQYFDSAEPENTAYPWTQLGYTYDWGAVSNHRGLSEFVVAARSKVRVSRITTPAEYCGVGAASPSPTSTPSVTAIP